MKPEEQIRANVRKALWEQKQEKKPVKKQNVFVKGVCKSLRTRSTDLSEVIEICEGIAGLTVEPELAALTLCCAHNNTQVREKVLASSGDDPGEITPENMALATGEEYTPTDFALAILALKAAGVLVMDTEGFYRVTLYAE